jgi:hypothetical protein
MTDDETRSGICRKTNRGKDSRAGIHQWMSMSPNIDDRPTCSKCNAEMLRGIAEPIVPGYELRNFECPSCGDKLKLVGYEGPINTMSKPE